MTALQSFSQLRSEDVHVERALAGQREKFRDIAIREAKRLGIPVVGIGGLNKRTVAQLAGSGVDGAAVVSAIFASDDCEAAAAELHDLMEGIVEY